VCVLKLSTSPVLFTHTTS